MKFHYLRWMAAALTAAVCFTVFFAAQSHPAHAQAINCADTATTGIPQSECAALVAIYTTGYPSGETGELPCDWSGITCTGGRVTGVELYAQKAAQTVPNLSVLTKLANLRLIPVPVTDFYFAGYFPVWITSSASLKTVDVSDNYFYGTMPSLSSMTALEALSLKNNGIDNGLPALPLSLKTLDASDNKFFGAIPASYGSLTNLTSLNLDGNNLNGEVPAGFASIPWASLTLSYNALFTANPDLVALLNLHDPDFFATQTVPPTDVTVSAVSTVKATISWTPVTPISGGGGYDVCVGTTSGNYNYCTGVYDDIQGTYTEITGLTPATSYHGVIRAYSDPHGLNDNEVHSSNSTEFTFTTKPTVTVIDCTDTATTGIPQSECEAVMGMSAALTEFWEEGLPPCDWYNVSCRNGHVTRIESYGHGLNGTMPDLSALTHLERFYLSMWSETLNGGFPAWIAASSNLKNVVLENTGLGGPLPDLSAMISLETLNLDQNNFSGPLPDLSAMTSLKQLGIGANNFSGPLPDLSMLPNLKVFWATDNDFSGTIHSGITASTSLELLMLDMNDLTGTIPDLSGMTALGLFNARDNDLSGNLPPISYFPPNIQSIELAQNHLTGTIPVSYLELPLEYGFSLEGNMLTGEIPRSAEGTYISAYYNALTDPSDPFHAMQTLPPSGINVTHTLTNSAYLSWTPISYTQDAGSYQVGLSTTSGSGYVFNESTADKSAFQIVLHGLTPNTTYYGVIRTVTLPHASNPNTVTSPNSAEFSFTTPASSSLVNCGDTAATGIPQSECETLIPLYATGFPSGEDGELPCDWNSITCTNGHVTGMDISNHGLSGTVPNLSALTHLEIFDASNNSFTGDFPTWISSSSALREVDLSWNQFNGYIPSYPTMPALERLSLNNNSFNGYLSNLGSLPNLRWLDAANNNVGFYSSPNQWPKLEYISIEGNNRSGTIPPIANIPTLLTFRAGRNQFTGAIPALPPNIRTIDLSYNQLTGAIPSFPSSIQTINLSFNGLSGTIPSSLGNLPALRSLNLDSNAFSGAAPSALTNIQQWDQLSLSYNALTTSYSSLITLLNAKDPDFFATQTVPPTSITFSNVTSNRAEVWWTPMGYTATAGYYRVRVRPETGSDVFHIMVNTSSSLVLINLKPNTTYDVAIQTVIYPHAQNPNTVTSPYSATYTFRTPYVNCANTAATGIPQAECDVLIAKIQPALKTIDYTKQPCAWSMIRCEGGHVVAMRDNTSYLSAIPDLSGLPYLQEIEFCCSEGGSFPTWIANASTLRIVKLGANDLSGSLPNLSAMISLEELDLSNNNLTGESLPDISALSNLRVLDLRGNSFYGSLHPSIAASTTLEFVCLDGNNLSGTLPDMSAMTSLHTFSASFNRFTGTLPAFAPGIEIIAFMWNRLTGEIPASYGELPNLVYLALHSNALTGEIPANLRAEFPYFQYNGLTASDPEVIAMLNQRDPEFFTTQTVPPTGIAIANVTPVSADLSWTPIVYTTNEGKYEVGLSTTSGSGYLFSRVTSDKMASSISLSGLAPATTYYGVIRTVTKPWGWGIDPFGHPYRLNENTVTSLNSAEFTFTTGFDPNALNCADTATTGIPQAECEALVAVFPDRTENVSPCTWSEITCTGGHVTGVHLSESDLSGTVPDLSALTQLEELELWSSVLTGEFPAWIAASSTLRTVTIRGSHLSGTIPDLSAMVSLEVLALAGNDFSGPLPDISMLPNLTVLGLSGNNISGTLHAGVTASTSLEILDVNSNALSGPLPDLSTLSSLKEFIADNNQFSGPLPALPPSLTQFALGLNHLTGEIPLSYGNLQPSSYLKLNGNMLTGEIPGNLNTLSLYLDFNGLTATDPATIAWLTEPAAGNPDFFGTQTLSPTGASALNVTPTSADLSWTPIAYTADAGSYEVGISTVSGSGYVFSHSTTDKLASGISLSGLAPETTYYVVVRTVTQPHAFNPNTVTSLNSAEFSFTTLVDPVSAPVLLSPAANGTVRGTNSPVLSWLPNPAGEGVTTYRLVLKNDATGVTLLKQNISAATCAAACAVDLGGLAPQIDLAIGVYNWQVTATGSLGMTKSLKQRFSVVKPDAPVITAPLGTVSDPQPDLTWTVNPEDMNTRYKLKLTGVKSGVVFKQTVSGVCSGAACAVGLDVLAGGPYLLKNDTYTLMVKAINEIGGRKATSTFKVKFPAPAVNLAPTGGLIVNTPHPVLSWTPDSNASSFQVVLNRIKDGVIVKTFKVSNLVSGMPGFACSAGTCTLDLAALASPLALPKGNYAWKVISSNPAIHPTSNSKSAKAAFKIVLP